MPSVSPGGGADEAAAERGVSPAPAGTAERGGFRQRGGGHDGSGTIGAAAGGPAAAGAAAASRRARLRRRSTGRRPKSHRLVGRESGAPAHPLHTESITIQLIFCLSRKCVLDFLVLDESETAI